MLLIENAAYFAAADSSTGPLPEKPSTALCRHAAHGQAVTLLTGSFPQASGRFYIVRTNSQYYYCRFFEITLI